MIGSSGTYGGAVVTLTGPGSERARETVLALLHGLGMVTLVEPGSPGEGALEVAARTRSVVLTATPVAEDRAAPFRARGVRFLCQRLDPADRAEDVAQRVLAFVDHGLEVATRTIFIVGEGRSGTTWTFDLLSSHRQVSGLFETKLFAPESLGHLGRANAFEEAHTRDDRRYPIGMWQLASREEAVRAVRAPAADWLGRHVAQHHNWLVEKTPASSHAARAIVEVFPRARFIHVVRDPRDVIASRLHPPASRHPAARSRRRLAIGTWSARWVGTLQVMNEAASFAPVAQIHYESLVSRPRETCRELFEFCEIPCDEAELSDITHRNRLEAHTRRGPGLFRGQGRVGGWRSKLSRGDEALVRAMAGPEMAAHGYIAQPGLPYAARRAARPVIRLVRERP